MPVPTAGPMHVDPTVVVCPKCNGQVWDNRATKKGNQPDYRCKNRSCDGAIWLTPKGGTKKNGTIPPTAAPVVESGEKPKLAGLYMEATEFVLNRIVPLYEKAEIGVSDEAVAAMVATLFIAKSKEL